ncbi:ribose transport system substrate-binding protein [Amycolatopsis bartoniae]|uniref:LacI family transcriptional regulator n=1 Tax=Amycolatopsis bartoniae TaxID=941986 RepID=A0A8H9IS79_9PSEU|nr:ABC transporter substrate-binding protein [Amycolatopsis bartoniae]MBB2939627.1 ribose transport system substrate-binding protein [Amycolatopsis bartoniae]TVT07833.1 ABC transporter substrate-binding protein [Amycolatopsis bartoniae]GHF39709.1 LacI family transcriptional regulator [Amycolatopsis bartoniae]
MSLSRSPRLVLVTAAAAALTLAACTSREETPAAQSSGSGPAASAASTAPTSGGCTLTQTGYPKIDPKTAIIGFSQSEKEANPFRIAETQSIRDEAAKLGIPADHLLTTNAQSDLNKQISDIKSLLDRGAQLLVVAPLNSDGLQPALDAAKAKKVPVVTVDRKVTSQPCTDYLTFIGSDFVKQGQRAAQEMARVTGGSGKVAILLGSSGNNVTTDRTQGFKDELAKTSGLSVVAEQTGDFDRSKGQAVMEQLIQSHPDLTAVYAENDEMGIGAVNALRTAGKTPGKDVKVVSVDGTRNAVQLIADGSYNAVIESNPRFGPLAFQTLQQFEDGQPIPASIVISDDSYDETNAAQKVGNAY